MTIKQYTPEVTSVMYQIAQTLQAYANCLAVVSKAEPLIIFSKISQQYNKPDPALCLANEASHEAQVQALLQAS